MSKKEKQSLLEMLFQKCIHFPLAAMSKSS